MNMKLAAGGPSRAIDTALDRTLMLGYRNVGIAPRTESDADRRKPWRRCETLVERARMEVAA